MVKKLTLVAIAVAALFANSAYADTKSKCHAKFDGKTTADKVKKRCDCVAGKTNKTSDAAIQEASDKCKDEGN